MAYSKPCTWTDITPTSGQTINIPIVDAGTTSNVCMNNPVLILALTIVFPVTGVQDGQLVKIASQGGVTALTMNVESGGVIQGLLTSLLGAGNGIYQFRASNKTWYKFSA